MGKDLIPRRTFLRGSAAMLGGVLATGPAFAASDACRITESDILGPSEAFRAPMDYYSHSPNTAAVLERLAREQPTTLACMHGSAWRGDGAALLRALAGRLQQDRLRAQDAISSAQHNQSRVLPERVEA